MTARDRIAVVAVATVALLVAAWLVAVSPERRQAAQIAGELSSAQARLQSAESQLASASAAQAGYQADYAAIVSLGKAVPAGQQLPSLIYELAQASGRKSVEFASIASSGSAGASTAAGGSAGSSSATSAAAPGGGFQQMPFTFVFNGTFTGLYSLFDQLDGFAQRTSAGELLVSGRLLTVQSVKLAPATGSETGSGSGAGRTSEQLSGTITATAYVLPDDETLTGGATPAGPASATTPAAAAAAPSSSNAPAVIEVNP